MEAVKDTKLTISVSFNVSFGWNKKGNFNYLKK